MGKEEAGMWIKVTLKGFFCFGGIGAVHKWRVPWMGAVKSISYSRREGGLCEGCRYRWLISVVLGVDGRSLLIAAVFSGKWETSLSGFHLPSSTRTVPVRHPWFAYCQIRCPLPLWNTFFTWLWPFSLNFPSALLLLCSLLCLVPLYLPDFSNWGSKYELFFSLFSVTTRGFHSGPWFFTPRVCWWLLSLCF